MAFRPKNPQTHGFRGHLLPWSRYPLAFALHAPRPDPFFHDEGVENGMTCLCNMNNKNYERLGRLDDIECEMPCAGDHKTTCGGRMAVDVFKMKNPKPECVLCVVVVMVVVVVVVVVGVVGEAASG